jgi:hypothetical protein
MNFFSRSVFLICLASLFFSCKESGYDPAAEKLKDPREMTWTADTLKMPDTAIQLLPEDLLVVSPQDIWLAVWVGHGQIWHYDGKTWMVVEDIGGAINCLLKKSDTDLWAGGHIGRYDGNNVVVANYNNTNWIWTEMAIKGEIWSMCIDPSGNVYAGGSDGLILKYSNKRWDNDTINVSYKQIFKDVSHSITSMKYYQENIHLLTTIHDPIRKKYVYYYLKGNLYNWSIQDSMIQDSQYSNIKWGNDGLHVSDDNIIYSYGFHGIWKYDNNQWIQSYYLDGEMYGMYALRKDYIIAISAFNRVFFYNGSSWQTISSLFKNQDPYFEYKFVKVVNKEIYIVGYGVIKNKDVVILYHGK